MKLKKVKYEIGEDEAFGDASGGDIREAFVLLKQYDVYLLFHPALKGECASISTAVKDGKVFVECTDSYINLNPKVAKKIVKIFEKYNG